jgi:hypothetical protein
MNAPLTLQPSDVPSERPATWALRLGAIVPLTLANSLLYLWVNHSPPSTPTQLAPTWLDRHVPFMLWTIWPYALLLLSDAVLPLFFQSRWHFLRMLRAYAVAIALNFTVWSLYPTCLPRPTLPQDASGATLWLYQTMMGLDQPNCCFPSGHITIPTVLVWALGQEQPKLRPYLWAGLALLAPSILTTHQHIAADLAGGLTTAAVGATFAVWSTRPAKP